MKVNSSQIKNNNNVNNLKTFKYKKGFIKYILSLEYLPRWIIFCIDVMIVALANVITYTVVKNLEVEFYDTLSFVMRFSITMIVNVIFFLLFKTYSGIIRHSSFIDVIKLLLSTSCALITLTVINYGTYFISGKKIYLIAGLFINFVITFVLLFLFRIFVKKFFELFSKRSDEAEVLRTMIYGTDANAIFVANALKSEFPSRFKLMGFISKSENKSARTIHGLTIFSQKRGIPVLMRSKNANALIIADKSLSIADKITIVDRCLEYNIKVFTLPAISDWEDANEISRKVKNIEIADLLERSPIILDNMLISRQVKSKTILISGAAGSIGSEIVWQILSFKPDKIILVDQAETPLHHLTLELSKADSTVELKSLIADIRNYDTMEDIFEKHKPSIVYHAAAYKHVPLMEENPAQAIFTNVKGTKNLADLSIKYNVGRFVMISTDKAVNPSNVMGASKRIAEKYVQSLSYRANMKGFHETKFITTRFGNVLGSNGSVVPLFTKQIEIGGPVTITHQDIIRYFMTIPEACQLVLEAGAMGNGGEIYIFDMGKPVKIIDLARKMIKLAGFIPDKDISIKIIGLRPGEKLYEELLNDTSKTVATHNEKIMIAQENETDFVSLHAAINELIHIASLRNNDHIVAKMKEIVPEFKSMNSTFQLLDK
jgi:FlaA1/EpsC-like NDP-sugar epimerase